MNIQIEITRVQLEIQEITKKWDIEGRTNDRRTYDEAYYDAKLGERGYAIFLNDYAKGRVAGLKEYLKILSA